MCRIAVNIDMHRSTAVSLCIGSQEECPVMTAPDMKQPTRGSYTRKTPIQRVS